MITFCIEYKGKENLIKSFLLELIRIDYPEFDPKILRFSIIGKKSNAHAVAIDVFRKNRRPNKILNKEDIEKFLK